MYEFLRTTYLIYKYLHRATYLIYKYLHKRRVKTPIKHKNLIYFIASDLKCREINTIDLSMVLIHQSNDRSIAVNYILI